MTHIKLVKLYIGIMVLLLAGAAAARHLEGDVEASAQDNAQQQHASPALQGQRIISYSAALHNSSCHGFLVGIGTQKGGTTALWAYIADNAHPHLRVSKTKELGFWDTLHTRYTGCRVGDYLQLQTMDEPQGEDASPLKQPQRDQQGPATQLPLCKALSAFRLGSQPLQEGQQGSWATSSGARLLPSKDCSITQRVWNAEGVDSGPAHGSSRINSMSAATATSSAPTAAPLGSFNLHNSRCLQGLFLPGDVVPPKPWWWFWAKWPSAPDISCLQKGGDGQHQQQTELEKAEPNGDSGSAPAVGSARLLLQQQAELLDPVLESTSQSQAVTSAATGTTPVGILGAPAQLDLPMVQHAQPMYHADITPRYLFDPAVPPRVHSLLPEARIIVILRDPVSRAVSNFNMWWQKHASKNSTGRVTTWPDTLTAQIDGEIARLSACYSSVGSAPATQPELSACLGLQHPYSPGYDEALFANRLLAQGIYADGLQRWFQLFPAESFLIWVSEDFKSKPAAHMRDLAKWLGLHTELLSPQLQDASSKLKAVHGRHYEGSPNAEVVARMGRFFEPHDRRLFELLEAKGFGAVAARMRKVWLQ